MPKAPTASHLNDPQVRAAFAALAQASQVTGQLLQSEPAPVPSYAERIQAGVKNLAALQPQEPGDKAPDFGSTMSNPAVASALQGLANLPQVESPQRQPDFGSTMSNPAVASALQGLANLPQVQSPQRQPDFGSIMSSPAVASALQGLANLPQVESPQRQPDFGSTMSNPAVASALQGLANLPQVEAPQRPADFGSTMSNPAVASALQGLANLPQVEAPQRTPDFGSTMSNPAVASALQGLANLPQVQSPERQPDFGSTMSNPAVASALQGLANLPGLPSPAPSSEVPQASLNDSRVAAAVQSLNQGEAAPNLITIKNALNGGELSSDMLARFDLPRFQMGCEKLLNMIPLPGGGICRRPGLAYVGTCGAPEQGHRAAMLPFTYSTDIQLMLILIADKTRSMLYMAPRDGDVNPWQVCRLPYNASEIDQVSFCQCGKNIYAAHENHPPARLVFDGTSFSYEVIDFVNRVPVPEIAGFGFEGRADENTGRNQYYKVTAIDPETGRESLPSEEYVWFTCTLTSAFSALIKIKTIPGIREYRIYKRHGGEYGFIGRLILPEDYQPEEPGLFITGTEADVFHDTGIVPDTADQPPREQTFFDGPGNYPSIVFLHQQRLGWASSKNDPLTLWLSQTSVFEDLSSKQPPRDDDGIEATLASTQANRILWAVSDRTGLAIGTAGEEWYLTGAAGEGSAISPNSLSFQPQTRYGTRPGLAAIRADASILFCQAGGRAVRDLGYSFQADRYEARDLTLLARHLFRFADIRAWCWQGYPFNILWCVLSSGRMAGLTYMPDQEVIAWHRHETAGEIQSCATLADSAGRSRLWLITLRHGPTDEFHVEMLSNLNEGQPDEWDGAKAPQTLWLDGRDKLPYKARCIPCLPETGMENGATTMRVKKINAVNCRVLNSAPFACQISGLYSAPGPELAVPHAVFDFATQDRQRLKELGFVPGLRDWGCPTGAGFRDNTRLELIFDRPAPATVLGLTVTLDVAREGSGQI